MIVISSGIAHSLDHESAGTDYLVLNAGTLKVLNKGHGNNIQVSSGGCLQVNSGALATQVTLLEGGATYHRNAFLDVSAGGIVSSADVHSGGLVNNHGGTLKNVTVHAGGFAQDFADQYGPGSDSGTVVSNGGEFSVQSGARSTNLTVQTGGLLTICSGATVTGLNVTSGSRLTFTDFEGNLSYSAHIEGATLQVLSGGDVVQSVGLNTRDYDGQDFVAALSSDQYDVGKVSVAVCYLSGSLIATPTGEVPVETLAIGDTVCVLRNGVMVEEPIVWTGRKTVGVSVQPDDRDLWPVRVRAHALAHNVPHKDLLITSEHCLHFGGKLIPVRMLVNGRSIVRDYGVPRFNIFHIELNKHGIVLANGVEAESYLDTGNRSNFRQDGKLTLLFPGAPKSWEHDAAGRLCTDRPTVEPIYEWIEARALDAGLDEVEPQREQTAEPGLHLMTDEGAVLRPIRNRGKATFFMVPPNASSVRILSRAARPSEIIGPYVDDRRRLGVLVEDITLWDASGTRILSRHLEADLSKGWHPEETSKIKARWTNGDAVLELGPRKGSDVGILSLTILAAGPYFVDEAVVHEAKAASF